MNRSYMIIMMFFCLITGSSCWGMESPREPLTKKKSWVIIQLKEEAKLLQKKPRDLALSKEFFETDKKGQLNILDTVLKAQSGDYIKTMFAEILSNCQDHKEFWFFIDANFAQHELYGFISQMK